MALVHTEYCWISPLYTQYTWPTTKHMLYNDLFLLHVCVCWFHTCRPNHLVKSLVTATFCHNRFNYQRCNWKLYRQLYRLHNPCIPNALDYQSEIHCSSYVSIYYVHSYKNPALQAHTLTLARLHIFDGTWHVPQQSCPFACSWTRLPKMSHWIFNMCNNLMMAETQSMALIIQASTAESSRPLWGLWLLLQNLLTSVSLCSSASSIHICSIR